MEAFSYVDGSGALRAMELVGGKAEQVDACRVEIYRVLPHHLNGVGVEKRPLVRGHLGHFGQGHDHAGFVVGRHYRNDRGLLIDKTFEAFKVYLSIFVHRGYGKGAAILLKSPGGEREQDCREDSDDRYRNEQLAQGETALHEATPPTHQDCTDL